MCAARLIHALDADFVEVRDQRRADRRAGDRRIWRVRLDPMFAATLVNHVARPEASQRPVYDAPRPHLRSGIVVNLNV